MDALELSKIALQAGSFGVLAVYFLWIQPKQTDRMMNLLEKMTDKNEAVQEAISELRADLPQACQYLQLSRRGNG